MIWAPAWSTPMGEGSILAQRTNTQLANLPNIDGKTLERNALFSDKLPCHPMLLFSPLLTSQTDVFHHGSSFCNCYQNFATFLVSRIKLYESHDVPRFVIGRNWFTARCCG